MKSQQNVHRQLVPAWRCSANALAAAFLLAALSDVFGNEPAEKGKIEKKPAPESPPKAGAPAVVRLSKKMPFGYVPKLGRGTQLIAMHYVQFDTKEGGEPILARVFLIGAFPDRTGNPKIVGKGRPARIFGTGQEVETPPSLNNNPFVPDFVVDKKFVDKVPKSSSYNINLGDVKYRVVTTREP